VDPQQVAVWGQSAGANLADLVGVTGDQRTVLDDASLGNPATSSAVPAVVDWYGPTDFAQLTAQSRKCVSQCAFP
jgi:acetyl esterase/lipase